MRCSVTLMIALCLTACGGASPGPESGDGPAVAETQALAQDQSINALCEKIAEIDARGGWPKPCGEGPPALLVGALVNRSRDFIDEEAWRRAVEEALTKQGIVSLVSESDDYAEEDYDYAGDDYDEDYGDSGEDGRPAATLHVLGEFTDQNFGDGCTYSYRIAGPSGALVRGSVSQTPSPRPTSD